MSLQIKRKSVDEDDLSLFGLIATFWRFLGPYRARYCALTAATFVCGTFLSLGPLWAFGQIGVHLMEKQPNQILILKWSVGLTVCSFLAGAIQRRVGQALGRIAFQVQSATRLEGYGRLMAQPYAWHQDEVAGQKVQRLNQGVSDLQVVFQYFCGNLFNLFAAILSILVMFVALRWTFAPFLLCVIVATFIGERWFYDRLRATFKRRNKARERSSGVFNEVMSHIFSVKVLGATAGLSKLIEQNEAENLDAGHEQLNIKRKKGDVFITIKHLGMLGILMLISYEVYAGRLVAAMTVTYILYYQRLFNSADDLVDIMNELLGARAGVGRMLGIYDIDPPVDGTHDFPANWQELRVQNLSFSYPGNTEERPALSNLELTVTRGMKIGIVGESGSGKSTLSKLLLGLYDATIGSITVDDLPLHAIAAHQRSLHISAVPQETELFNGTMAQNITLWQEPDSDRLAHAIKVAQLDPVIAQLPDGIETKIGEKGYRLSGGQRQRLGIARALYSQASILILDEATAALDSRTEVLLQQSLESQENDRTLIVIAHRLSTLRNVDIIYVLDDGKVIESGSFEELLAIPDGAFNHLYQLQQRTRTS